jgi:hypothetical protein
MGPSFQLDRSDVWFRIPFSDPDSIRDSGLIEQVQQIYLANLPILAPARMMKRQTRVLIDFAEDFAAREPRMVS